VGIGRLWGGGKRTDRLELSKHQGKGRKKDEKVYGKRIT